MQLHDIIDSNGANRQKRRLGKGEGNGHGKTCGKGHKGQKARSGGGIRVGFESGHIPLYRRLPQRGFSNFKFRKEFAVVNLEDLARLGDVDVVNRESLAAAGLIRNNAGLVKLLGEGEVTRAYKVQLDKVSGSARAKVEAAGGEVSEA
ncbi:MAG: 50S ribosomal protein L15 [Puniceicoccaceae bacterium]